MTNEQARHLIIFNKTRKSLVSTYKYQGSRAIILKVRGSEKEVLINNDDTWGSCLYSQKIFPLD